MFFFYTYSGIREAEVIERIVLAETVYGDVYVCSCVCYGIVHQVSEDGVQQRVVAVYHQCLWHKVYHLDMFLFQSEIYLVDYILYHKTQVHSLSFHHFRCLVHTGQYGDVAQKGSESVALCVASFQEGLYSVLRYVRITEYCLQISLNAAYGGFKLVSDVLRELPFQSRLFFFLSDVVN